MSPLLEIATFSLEAAIIAAEAGADRIELCIDYAQGGLTPPVHMIAAASRLSCPVFVMIRPRHGDFIYPASELDQMHQQMLAARQHGAGGFVFGILQADGGINEQACRQLVTLAAPLPCTFHRAFDDLPDKQSGLEILIRCGFRRLLSSGGEGNAAGHHDGLKALVHQAAHRIVVMPGGGVRPANLASLASGTGAAEYHSAAISEGTQLPDARAIAEMKQVLRDVVIDG